MCIRREQLVTCKENLIEKQKSLSNVMDKLQIEQKRLKNATNEKEANRNFNKQKTISVIEIEEKEYYSTVCTQHGKVQVCREHCGLRYEPNLNVALLLKEKTVDIVNVA